MTTDSPTQSFASSQGSAMDIDSTPPSSAALPPTSQLLYTTGHPLTTFHPFPRLSSALRTRIWALAMPSPRTRFIELYNYNAAKDYTPRIRYIPPLPALFSTCRESREVSIRAEGGETMYFVGKKNTTTPAFYFNFSRDILFLSSRFTAAYNTTETFRLRELSVLLPFLQLNRLKRVLVTYSGLDNYSRIGPVMRPYASLEVLYIGMVDWWSSRVMKRLVRKGKPQTGVVARTIERVIVETEAEETDDDDEADEHLRMRLAVRERRRILEVEVRLDE